MPPGRKHEVRGIRRPDTADFVHLTDSRCRGLRDSVSIWCHRNTLRHCAFGYGKIRKMPQRRRRPSPRDRAAASPRHRSLRNRCRPPAAGGRLALSARGSCRGRPTRPRLDRRARRLLGQQVDQALERRGVPSATTSTRPSAVLRAWPTRPSSSARARVHQRKPTPWTRPRTNTVIRRSSSGPHRSRARGDRTAAGLRSRPHERASVTAVTTSPYRCAHEHGAGSRQRRGRRARGRRTGRRPGGTGTTTRPGRAARRARRPARPRHRRRAGLPPRRLVAARAASSGSTCSSWSPASSSRPCSCASASRPAASTCPASGPAAPAGCCPRSLVCVPGIRAARAAQRGRPARRHRAPGARGRDLHLELARDRRRAPTTSRPPRRSC